MALTRSWIANWAARPDSQVLAGPTADGAQAVLTGSEMIERTTVAAFRLAAGGVQPGDRVLLSGAPSIELVLAYVGILRLGAVVVPANVAYTEPELEHLIRAADPVLAVLDDQGRTTTVPTTSVGLDTLPEVGPVPLDKATQDAPAYIGFTSGTTGKPKGAVLSHRNLAAGADAVVSAWHWTAADRLLVALPLFHVHGLGVAVNGTFAAGARLSIRARFDPADLAAAIESDRATMFFGVPTMYARLAQSGHLSRLSGLRLLVSGSAPLDPALFETIAEQCGQPPLERYGMTETLMITSNPIGGPRQPGRVGHPLPQVEVRLGADNVVEVRGPNVFSGYLGEPEGTGFTGDGWFRTGDIGEFDETNSLQLVGRSSDLIITGGYNVYPREVEDVLRTHPGVADVAVIGLPDPTFGESVAAFIVASGDDPRPEMDQTALALAPYKRPRLLFLSDELPRNAMGKVQRDVLIQEALAHPHLGLRT